MHLQEIKTVLKNEDGIHPEYIMRFSRMAEKYGYDNPNKDILEFCALIVDNPDAFKKLDMITSSWRKPKTVSEMFRGIKTVCASNTIRPKLGNKYHHIAQELDKYKKEVVRVLQDGQREPTKIDDPEQPSPHEIEHINNAQAKPPKTTNAPRADLYKAPPSTPPSSEPDDISSSENMSEQRVRRRRPVRREGTLPPLSKKRYRKIMSKLMEIQRTTHQVLSYIHDGSR